MQASDEYKENYLKLRVLANQWYERYDDLSQFPREIKIISTVKQKDAFWIYQS